MGLQALTEGVVLVVSGVGPQGLLRCRQDWEGGLWLLVVSQTHSHDLMLCL